MKKLILAATLATSLAVSAAAQDGGLDLGDTDEAPLLIDPGATAVGSEILNNTLFGDWLVNCEAITTTRVQCSIVQQLSVADTDQLIVRMVALPAGNGTAILLAQVPIGAYLPGGAVYRFDNDDADEPQRSMVWQRCLGQLCEAAVQLDEEELAHFAANDRMLFGFRPGIDQEPIIVSLDISEFTEALDAISGN